MRTIRRITAGDVNYAVVDERQGPAVLLLHGFSGFVGAVAASDPGARRGGIPRRRARSRGFGDSDKPQEVEGRSASPHRGRVTLLDTLELGRVHVVGHDLGAALNLSR